MCESPSKKQWTHPSISHPSTLAFVSTASSTPSTGSQNVSMSSANSKSTYGFLFSSFERSTSTNTNFPLSEDFHSSV